MKLEQVTKLDKRNKITSKNLMVTVCCVILTRKQTPKKHTQFRVKCLSSKLLQSCVPFCNALKTSNCRKSTEVCRKFQF